VHDVGRVHHASAACVAGDERELDVGVEEPEQRQPAPDEYWRPPDVDLVDEVRTQEGLDDFPTVDVDLAGSGRGEFAQQSVEGAGDGDALVVGIQGPST
jgi:hypothetical protein